MTSNCGKNGDTYGGGGQRVNNDGGSYHDLCGDGGDKIDSDGGDGRKGND